MKPPTKLEQAGLWVIALCGGAGCALVLAGIALAVAEWLGMLP